MKTISVVNKNFEYISEIPAFYEVGFQKGDTIHVNFIFGDSLGCTYTNKENNNSKLISIKSQFVLDDQLFKVI